MRAHDMSQTTRVNKPRILASGALFSSLDAIELELFAQFATMKTLDGGTVIFAEGSEGDAMYVIASGRVRISLMPAGRQAIVLGTLGRGETFGEISVLDGKERTATAETMELSELLSIRREDLLGCLQIQPVIGIKLLAALASRLRMTDERIQDSLSLNLPSRLAKALISLARSYGFNTTSGVEIDVLLYEDELAYRLKAQKEKIAAQIEAWKNEDILDINRNRLVITDPYKLALLV
jgi:CRP/FNR family transcriptional regulator, cyclic AMP receptor protein